MAPRRASASRRPSEGERLSPCCMVLSGYGLEACPTRLVRVASVLTPRSARSFHHDAWPTIHPAVRYYPMRTSATFRLAFLAAVGAPGLAAQSAPRLSLVREL